MAIDTRETIHSLELAASQVAYRRGKWGDTDVWIDAEFDGFSHHYEQDALTIDFRVLDPECEKRVNRPSELRVTYQGNTVFLISEDVGKLVTYIPGDWEKLLQKEYASIVEEERQEAAQGLPF